MGQKGEERDNLWRRFDRLALLMFSSRCMHQKKLVSKINDKRINVALGILDSLALIPTPQIVGNFEINS